MVPIRVTTFAVNNVFLFRNPTKVEVTASHKEKHMDMRAHRRHSTGVEIFKNDRRGQTQPN